MSKMKNCKSCNAEIAKSAKVCPHCGAKNKPAIYKRPWFILILVILIGGIALGSGGSDEGTDAGTQDVSGNEAQQEVSYTAYSVSQLIDDLENNAMKAAETYNGQYVELTGELSTIDSGGSYVSVAPTGEDFCLYDVTCYIQNDEQKQVVMELSSGDGVKVKGKITDVGEVLGYYLDIDSIEAN